MTERRAHVQRATQGTLVQHIVAAQMHFGSFASGAQLLQVTIAEFVFLVPLVTNRLSVGDALGTGAAAAGVVGLASAMLADMFRLRVPDDLFLLQTFRTN